MADERPPIETERRRRPRRVTTRFVWYKIVGEGSHETWLEGIATSFDISDSGLGFTATRPLPVNVLVFVELSTPRFSLSALGRVVRVVAKGGAEGNYHVGIELLIVPPNDVIRLRRYTNND